MPLVRPLALALMVVVTEVLDPVSRTPLVEESVSQLAVPETAQFIVPVPLLVRV